MDINNVKELNSKVEGFNNDPNIFLNYMDNTPPLVITCMGNDTDDLLSLRAFLPLPEDGELRGSVIGGFDITDNQKFTTDEIGLVLEELKSNPTSSTITIHVNSENERLITLRKVFTIVTVKVDTVKYDIEKAKWLLPLETIIEIGDFVSDDHLHLTAGSYALAFNDQLAANNMSRGLKAHYDECYKIIQEQLSSSIDKNRGNNEISLLLE